MTKYNGETSVPTDKELILWGWNTNQISKLRQLPPELQDDVLQEYIRIMMEEEDSKNLNF
jgi:hypothetical protein